MDKGCKIGRSALIVKGGGDGEYRKFGSNAEYSITLWDDGRVKYKHNGVADTLSKSKVTLNEWTHIALVRDNGSKDIKIYVNGKLETINSYTIEPLHQIVKSSL